MWHSLHAYGSIFNIHGFCYNDGKEEDILRQDKTQIFAISIGIQSCSPAGISNKLHIYVYVAPNSQLSNSSK